MHKRRTKQPEFGLNRKPSPFSTELAVDSVSLGSLVPVTACL